MDRIVEPTEITVESLVTAIAEVFPFRTQLTLTRASNILDAIAAEVGTTRAGVAIALTRWRSELCGAAEVLPHVEADRDRLRAELEQTAAERDTLADILDQMLAPSAWSERFTVRPVPWGERTVDVARSMQEVSRVEAWTAQYLAIMGGKDAD